MTSQYNLTNLIKRACNCLIEDINRREFLSCFLYVDNDNDDLIKCTWSFRIITP